MAQKVLVQLVDDIDGSEADQSVKFGLDGVQYEIDLTNSHADELRGAIDKFISVGRRVGGGRTKHRTTTAGTTHKAAPSRPSGTTVVGADNNTIRVWAKSNGHKIGDKGRISQEIRDAFAAANPS